MNHLENPGPPETVIPDDTIDKIMTDIEEETIEETLKEPEEAEDLHKEDLFTDLQLKAQTKKKIKGF